MRTKKQSSKKEAHNTLVIPRDGKKIEQTILASVGKKIDTVCISSSVGKKTLAKIIFLLKPRAITLPISLARRMNLPKIVKLGVEVIITKRKRGRKEKADPSHLKEQYMKSEISRRTYYYWKKKLLLQTKR